jgi:hypothetical protein
VTRSKRDLKIDILDLDLDLDLVLSNWKSGDKLLHSKFFAGFTLLCLTPIFFHSDLFGEEELCAKCAIIREENKTKNFNNGQVYYEDYLDAIKDKAENSAKAAEPEVKRP